MGIARPTGQCGVASRDEVYNRREVERREALSRRRVQSVNRFQTLLAELLAGQAKKDIITGQAKKMLASVRPRDIAGKTRRRLAAEELAELVAVDAKHLRRHLSPAGRRRQNGPRRRH